MQGTESWEVGSRGRRVGKQKIESWGWEVEEQELCDEKQEIKLRMGSRGLGSGIWEAGNRELGRWVGSKGPREGWWKAVDREWREGKQEIESLGMGSRGPRVGREVASRRPRVVR